MDVVSNSGPRSISLEIGRHLLFPIIWTIVGPYPKSYPAVGLPALPVFLEPDVREYRGLAFGPPIAGMATNR